MLNLTADYFILALSVCVGVIQAAAAYSRLYGLLIVPHVLAGYALGLAVPSGAFAWFVHIGDVRIPGDIGGVEGAEQFALFLGSAAAATLLTAALASLTQLRRKGNPQPSLGMDALREATLLQVIAALVRRVFR